MTTATKPILTSIHGRRVGLARDGKLVVNGRTAIVQGDTGVAPVIQGAPGVLDTTGTLTAALIATGIVTSAAAAVTATVDTGAAMTAALGDIVAIGEAIDWSVIKVGANAFTLQAAASGHTIVGASAVATATSSHFRSRRTAAETWVTYRLS